MKNSLNTSPIADNTVAAVISSKNFLELSESSRKDALDALSNSKDKEAGIMGKFFGTKKEIVSMNITLVICILLTIIGCISKEYWNVIIPAITTGMGYMFGKGDK